MKNIRVFYQKIFYIFEQACHRNVVSRGTFFTFRIHFHKVASPETISFPFKQEVFSSSISCRSDLVA